MNKQQQLTFYKSEFVQYNFIIEDSEINRCVARFIFTYIALEAFYKKMLVAMKKSKGKTISKKERKNLTVTSVSVKEVLNYFELNYDPELIDRIFGSNDKNFMECSIKKLRDRLVHNVNDNVLRIIMERYETMMKDLDAFSAILK